MRHSIGFLLVSSVLFTACTPATQSPSDAAVLATPADTPAPAKTRDTAQSSPALLPDQREPTPSKENAPMQDWRALGTEPFWNVRVNGETLLFSTPEDQQGKTLQGRRIPSLVGMVYTGKDGDVDFTLDISPGQCSDGMSDTPYDHVSTFVYGDTTYRGCAKPGSQ